MRHTSACQVVEILPADGTLQLVGVLPHAGDSLVLDGILQDGVQGLETLDDVL